MQRFRDYAPNPLPTHLHGDLTLTGLDGTVLNVDGHLNDFLKVGQFGYIRTNWNPAYGDTIMPFVFLARLSPVGSIPFIAFYSVFATGGTIAAQESGLSVDFLKVIVDLILVFMTITEYVGTKRDLGQSYLPDELKDAFRKPLAAINSRGLIGSGVLGSRSGAPRQKTRSTGRKAS